MERTDDAAGLQPHELRGAAVYRLRILGSGQLWVLGVAYCQPGLAVATYKLPGPGRYSIELLMLYTSFSFAAPNTSKAVAAPWTGFLTLTVPAEVSAGAVAQAWAREPDTAAVVASGATAPEAPPSTLPLCPDTGPLPGRWRFARWPPADDADAAAAAALLRTCVFNHTVHDCRTLDRAPLRGAPFPATMHWRPDGCRLRAVAGITAPPAAQYPHQFPQQQDAGQPERRSEALAEAAVEPGTCLPPGRHVCFVGDSHSRYLHNSLALWRSGYRRSVNNTAKQVLPSVSSRYYRLVYGYDWPEPEPDGADPLGRHCTDVVVNFGQWPASYRAGPAPFSAGQYLAQLLRVRRRLLALRRQYGVRVYWLTTCSPSLKAWLESAGVDWRTDPLMLLYNRLAADVMSGALGEAEEAEAAAPAADAQAAPVAGVAGVDPSAGTAPAAETATAASGMAPAAGTGTAGGAGPSGRSLGAQELDAAAAAAVALAAERQPYSGRWSSRRRARARALQRRPSGDLPYTLRHPDAGPTAAAAAQRRRYSAKGARGRRWLHAEAAAVTSSEAEAALRQGWGPGGGDGEAEAIPLIDTWSAAAVLLEGTWDGVHFANTGPVGVAQLTSVLHTLCSEDRLREVAAAAVVGQGQAAGTGAGAGTEQGAGVQIGVATAGQ
ncbi:hypothetical protein GPECTOR_5g76 [Gonium pectorale]|uniref:Uncharacterized protein n=1 Tax=Gonium pectorale TaxID=33097 RepID=A0A150GXK5_GONPE|nr:hypothetical protein GPECTOR_5g76 [Gonium pectorale]|eukprot:KXZ54422.1 hypothetical protein GPECTOR_5g76 [Gonium pectorale]